MLQFFMLVVFCVSVGPTSAWNGDYHLNINLQMAYWAVLTTGHHDAALPLMHFLRELSVFGEKTATDVYGLPGWVAHGFTGILIQIMYYILCLCC